MSRNNKKYDKLSQAGAPEVDYKNIDLLKSYLTENSKIIPSRVTKTAVFNQRQISQAVKRARFIALLPYTDKH